MNIQKILLLICIIVIYSLKTYSKLYFIKVSDNSFNPSFLTIRPGDSVQWIWINGLHTISSTVIPLDAASWSNKISVNLPSFIYIPTIIGTYNYECTMNPIVNMVGKFYVAEKAGLNNTNYSTFISIYPNPASDKLHIQFHLKQMFATSIPVTIIITDNNYKQWFSKNYKSLKNRDIDIENFPNGTYNFFAAQGDSTIKQQILITH